MAALAVRLASYVQVVGPDATHGKAQAAGVGLSVDGRSTLGGSATLLPTTRPTPPRLLVPASLVLPFLTPARRGQPLGPVTPGDCLPGTAWAASLAGEEEDGGGGGGGLRPARPVSVLAAPGVAAALAPLAAAGWVPAWAPSGGARAMHSASAGLVAVLELIDGRPLPPPLAAAVAAAWAAGPAAAGPRLRPGDALAAAGAPLGPLSPSHFAGSALAGVVAGLGGPALGAGLALLDVRCLPGTEGGPVVEVSSGGLVGVLGPPLMPAAAGGGGGGGGGDGGGGASSAAPPWLAVDGLPTMLRLTPALVAALEGVGGGGSGGGGGGSPAPAVARAPALLTPAPVAALSLAPSIAAVAASTAALLVPGQSWATGVHVGRGVFLTAAHALPAAGAAGQRGLPIFVLAPSSSARRRPPGAPAAPAGHAWLPAHRVALRELERAAPGLDVAAVAVEAAGLGAAAPPPWPPARPPLPTPPPPGTPVAALGWPRLHPRVGVGPLVSAGVVSRVLSPGSGGGGGADQQQREEARPTRELLTTTAAIHPGGSGGPILAAADGSIVGLALANVRHSSGRSGSGGSGSGGSGREWGGSGGGVCIPTLNLCLAGAPLAAAWAAAAGGMGPLPPPPLPPGRADLWALVGPPPPPRPPGARLEGREALDALLKRAGLPGLGGEGDSRL